MGGPCRTIIYVLVILVSVSGSAANEQLDEMNETEFYDFLSNITYVTDIHDMLQLEYLYEPEIIWQQKGHIRAWIDIIGYEDMILDHGTFYILKNDSTILRYGCDHIIKGESWWNYNVDELEIWDVWVEFEDEKVIAYLKVNLKYHHSKIIYVGDPPKKKIKKKYYYETQVFSTEDPDPPKLYPVVDVSNLSASAIFHNNTVAPKTIVSTPQLNHISGIEYKYGNETATYHPTVYAVSRTAKGCPYGKVIYVNHWAQDAENKAVFHVYDNAFIKSCPVDFSLLNVTILSPYGSQEVTVNTTEKKFRYEPPDNAAFYSILGMLVAIIFFLRRI